MKEKNLLKLAVVCSIVGVLILYFISDNISIDIKTIDNINKENIGEDVKLLGVVDRVSDAEKVVFLEISQPQSITVILFKNKESLRLNRSVNLHAGNYVEVIGKIDEYEGKLEVIGHRIRVIE